MKFQENVNRSIMVMSLLVFSFCFGLTVFGGSSTSHAAAQLRLDPGLVKGPDACGECHKTSIQKWKATHHATSFKKLPRKKLAKKIAKAMGLKRIKAGSDCLTCHFTSAKKGSRVKPIAGITCESCHGAGKDWIDVHSEFGGKGVTAATEKPEHKVSRYKKSEAAGMIRPSRLYDVAQNCYSCHTVPNEKLVNVGGHPAGSKFDLVAWSQGEVRHNVWYSKDNNEASKNRKRMMYVVGMALDLEYALRGVAKATQKARFAVAMATRASAARKAMEKIAAAVAAPELKAILAAANSAGLKLNNEGPLTKAADGIQKAARAFSAKYDGSKMAAIDVMIPTKFMGQAAP